jgi:hypothetical protein
MVAAGVVAFVKERVGRPRGAERHDPAGYLRRVYKPKSRCVYCRRPLPKKRTRRRLYCSHSCAQMAYLRRKLSATYLMRALIADMKAIQRHAAITAEMQRQVDQALGETPDP